MTKNLETADTIVKLVLSVAAVLFYFFNLITGPFAEALMILGIVVISVFLTRVVYVKFSARQ